jgi:predicted transcriptional regulator
MEYNRDKVDEMVLALLYLTSFKDEYGTRAWKNMDWEAMDRLYEKGFISNPKGKAKSVVLTEAGEKASEALFISNFAIN